MMRRRLEEQWLVGLLGRTCAYKQNYRPVHGGHLNYPPVRMGMDRPKLEMKSNKEEVVTMNWSPDMKHDTNKEMIKYVG